MLCHDVVDLEEYHQSEVYREIGVPINIEYTLAVFLPRGDGTLTILGLMRRREDGQFAEHDKELLQAVVPHAYHALNFQWLLGLRDQGVETPPEGAAPPPYADLADEIRSTWNDTPDSGEGGEIRLTRRERDVLSGCALGLRSKEIAKKLGISTRTVEHHFAKAMQRLNAKSRAEAVAVAIASNLLD
ncbi:MAG: helix-turn-helix transcriptional regulator [Alphaproteobacteria bacterium]|nr:helix-turn-helix transcriptional regulator [Alphaproteobacteria bacterium]